jgi:phosphoglycolate phosphatase-like HAD superfamily hydrolase
MNLFIFDGGDTLWDTQPMYTRAIDELLNVAEDYGFSREATKTYLHEGVRSYNFAPRHHPI